jgi:hypothetical protein
VLLGLSSNPPESSTLAVRLSLVKIAAELAAEDKQSTQLKMTQRSSMIFSPTQITAVGRNF